MTPTHTSHLIRGARIAGGDPADILVRDGRIADRKSVV